ncbi:MAG: O-linked N-acetylglucosamine transferase, SPINDLY family protein [Limnospira sp. PMC 1042.18]|nr:O-linked N-acetylglucosamine transferase, SPINDLY family protein [Limnospira sp. PMC 1042.18]MDT9200354.1 O-linked N-acetylglucosamine transferase, SPINDLY family protein [Limnospira sp. PMC 1042.18]
MAGTMIDNQILEKHKSLSAEADICLQKRDYQQAAILYEQAINLNPDYKYNYWKLGLTLLLQEREEEAQTTWLVAMSDGEPEQIDLWTIDLLQVLSSEADARTVAEDYSVAWGIRQHIQQINPDDINNILQLIDLSITLKTYTGNEIAEYGLVSLLQQESINVNPDLLLHVWKKLLVVDAINPLSLELGQAVINHVGEQPEFVTSLIPKLYDIAYSFAKTSIAKGYGELLLNLAPNHQELLRALAQFCIQLTEYDDGIEYARRSYHLTESPDQQALDSNFMISGLMSQGGCTKQVREVVKHQESLLDAMLKDPPLNLGTGVMQLYNTNFFFPYVRDCPAVNSQTKTQVAQICQANLETALAENIATYQARNLQKRHQGATNKTLKIGYISYCFRRHSVGWISRWLFQHHDRHQFEIYAYMIGAENRQDALQNWYAEQATKSYQYGIVSTEVAEQISEDQIDILVDLDSLTLTNTCAIMALKPAPVQVTWLGWDASAIPTVDYFIADPYVLPENAQDYYSETIWRLPQTYVAVGGFEVGIPSLRRQDINIPENAIVYFTAQRGPKYNPELAQLQMQILKQVPNSYLIIKGFDKEQSIAGLFFELAEEQGVSREQLRLTGSVLLEQTHRADLAIADVVLDSYPYNGATTTMETLWMGIPLVTRVGEQFAARNSYTMMMNAGITEGIAWTDEEYVEWGVRLGTDERLRQDISWKLRKSRRTAPLWNSKQFTREMEKAYQEMWKIYTSGQS